MSAADLRAALARHAEERGVQRAALLHRLAWELRNTEAAETHRLANEALVLARDLGDDTAEAYALVARAYASVRLSHGAEAIADARMAVDLFRRIDHVAGLPRALNTLGIAYGDSSNFMDALEVFLDLLTICEKSGDRIGEADALNNVGIVYVNLDDHSAALEYHLRSLRLAREVGYASGEVRSLTNLGSVAFELGRHTEALEYLQESLAKRGEGADPHTYGITLVNQGRCFHQLGRHAEALEVLERAHELLGGLDHSLGVAYALDTLGAVHLDLGDEQGLDKLQASLAIKANAGDRKGQASTLLAVAKAHRQLGHAAAAEAALNDALEVSTAVGARSEVSRAHRMLSEIFEERGDLPGALHHFKTFHRVKDELFNDDSDLKLRALRIGFEVEQAQKANEIYRLKNVELARANHELEVLARSLREADAQKSRLLRQVERQAREDSLTGLGNRRHFDRAIGEAFPAARRGRRRFSVAIADIDHFKAVNDQFGHAAGDRVLKAVGRTLRAAVRERDLVARYGGEEFIFMFPDADADEAHAICERMRRAVETYDWSSIAPGLRVTLSIGVASDPAIPHHERLIAVADGMLYRAKAGGRNRVASDAFADAPAAGAPTSAPGVPAGLPRGASIREDGDATPPPGLSVQRRGVPLETITTQVGSIALLATRPQLEISEGTLDEGGRMTLVSTARTARMPEVYYLVDGELTAELPEGRLTVRAGDLLLVESLEQPVILTAATGTRFLFASPDPSFHEISQELDELRQLAVGVEFFDGYTADHCRRLQTIAYAIGEELGLTKHRLHLLDYAAYLHDVGKVRVPREILTKPGRLTEDEWTQIRLHPVHGAEMLAETFLVDAAPIVAQHHERLDGSGYPLGLRGDQILVEAHIVAVADTFDAMTSDRPYRAALPRESAIDELRRLSGRAFPAQVVDAFERVLPHLSV